MTTKRTRYAIANCHTYPLTHMYRPMPTSVQCNCIGARLAHLTHTQLGRHRIDATQCMLGNIQSRKSPRHHARRWNRRTLRQTTPFHMLAFSLSGSSVISIVTFDYPDGYCYTLLPDDRCYRARSRIAAATEPDGCHVALPFERAPGWMDSKDDRVLIRWHSQI